MDRLPPPRPPLSPCFSSPSPPPRPMPPRRRRFSVNSPSVTEGNSGTTTLTFTLTLSRASPEGKETVRYRDNGTGTATKGEDYVELSTIDDKDSNYAVVTFDAFETTATINVTVNGDTDVEAGRDDHPGPEQSGRRHSRRHDRHGNDHQRRSADAIDQLAEGDGRGGGDDGEPDLHGEPDSGEHTAGDGELGGGDGRHCHFRDGLHGHHGRDADLRGGDDQPDLQRVGEGGTRLTRRTRQ